MNSVQYIKKVKKELTNRPGKDIMPVEAIISRMKEYARKCVLETVNEEKTEEKGATDDK